MDDDAITAVQIVRADGKGGNTEFTIDVHMNNGEVSKVVKKQKDFEKFYKKKLPVIDRAYLKQETCEFPAMTKDLAQNKIALNRWFFRIFQMVSNKNISVEAKLALDIFLEVSHAAELCLPDILLQSTPQRLPKQAGRTRRSSSSRRSKRKSKALINREKTRSSVSVVS